LEVGSVDLGPLESRPIELPALELALELELELASELELELAPSKQSIEAASV